MAGHSRPKDGVASLAYVPAIHVLATRAGLKAWMPATSAGMTGMPFAASRRPGPTKHRPSSSGRVGPSWIDLGQARRRAMQHE
jgi:hypothetical protein